MLSGIAATNRWIGEKTSTRRKIDIPAGAPGKTIPKEQFEEALRDHTSAVKEGLRQRNSRGKGKGQGAWSRNSWKGKGYGRGYGGYGNRTGRSNQQGRSYYGKANNMTTGNRTYGRGTYTHDYDQEDQEDEVEGLYGTDETDSNDEEP